MASTFQGLEIARRGLSSHQQALQTTGHNISNADNKHYARQRVNLEAMNPLYNPSLNRSNQPGMIGQGSKVRDIERIRDGFVDQKINVAQQSQSLWETKASYLHNLEVILNEPADESIRKQLDDFWRSWQDLSQHPDKLSHREIVTTAGKNVAFTIRETYQRLADLRRQADSELAIDVARVNDIASQLAELNDRIMKSNAIGDNPNDLRDRRDALLQTLSEFADVSIEKQDADEKIVYLGGEMLVQGSKKHVLELRQDPANEGLIDIVWQHNNKDVMFRNGKIEALLEIRDGALKENIEKLDLLAVNIVDTVNEVHRDGFSLTKETNINFFDLDNLSRNIRGNYDLNGDGADEVTAVFKIAGKNPLIADRPLGITGQITLQKNDRDSTPVFISYRPDETLQTVIDRVNRSDAGVVAYLNHNNNLVFKAKTAEDNWQSNFMIRHLEDSGELLVGYSGILQNSGAGGAFDFRRIDELSKLQSNPERISLTPVYHPAASIDLSFELKNNPAKVAATTGEDIGGTGDVNSANGSKDGFNATRIAQALKHKSTMVGSHANADQFYNALVAKVGSESRTAKDQVENGKIVMNNLTNMRQSVMGVNLDEEMANMVQFQHGYNAAARILSIYSEMIERIIEKLI